MHDRAVRVEHPGVVPVYEVAVDAERQPLIVLRRIEGTEWESSTCPRCEHNWHKRR